MKNRTIDIDQFAERLLQGDRAVLAQAITLIESKRIDHQQQAHHLVQKLLPETGRSLRIGMTGAPGVGKSTTIDQFGCSLTAMGHKVAVLAVDPSSVRTGGSILGDKTRMAHLAQEKHAYIRPSPSSGTLGGVAAKTRETMLLCEAAGFDIILIETVGTGQSEIAVADMVDCFVALMLPGAGDELQGIKKGILEMADIIAVNKADGDGQRLATQAASIYRRALEILLPHDSAWNVPVLTISGLANLGLDTLWQQIQLHHETLRQSGDFEEKRQKQQVRWMWSILDTHLHHTLHNNKAVKARLADLESQVRSGKCSPTLAAREIATLIGL